MKLLNSHIGEEYKAVLFCFPPVELPINSDGEVVSEEQASGSHFSTIVYSVKDSEFVVMEFGKAIKHALAGYRSRHNRLRDLEILVFRDRDDGRLRITIGNVERTGVPFSEEEEELHRQRLHRLYNVYMNKSGYKVCDRGEINE